MTSTASAPGDPVDYDDPAARRRIRFQGLETIAQQSDSDDFKRLVDDVIDGRISFSEASMSPVFGETMGPVVTKALESQSEEPADDVCEPESAVPENVPTPTSTVTNSVAMISNSPAAPEPTPQADHVRPMFVSPDELWLASRETSK